MNTNIVLVDVILFLVILIPIAFLVIYTVSNDKRVKRNITKMSKKNGVDLNFVEINGDLVLGMDTNNRKLVCSERKNLESNFEVIDLNTISNCRVKIIKLSKHTMDWVGLELAGSSTTKEIPFYIENDDDSPASDPKIREQQAIKWEKLIKPYLKVS